MNEKELFRLTVESGKALVSIDDFFRYTSEIKSSDKISLDKLEFDDIFDELKVRVLIEDDEYLDSVLGD